MKNTYVNLINILKPFLKIFICLFFDKKYIQGIHFESGYMGFVWAIKSIWVKNILHIAPPRPWPTALTCHISVAKNIHFHENDLNNFQSPGTYFQNFKGSIYIGRGTLIAPNVGIITANHIIGNLEEHEDGRDVILGDNCWIGMNSVVLPGVVLGPNTVVAAGSVVNKSFVNGNCLIAGAPARFIRDLS